MVLVGYSASPRSGPWSVGRWLARSSAIHSPLGLEPPPSFALGFPQRVKVHDVRSFHPGQRGASRAWDLRALPVGPRQVPVGGRVGLSKPASEKREWEHHRPHTHCEKSGVRNPIRPEACGRHDRETVTQVDGQ